MGVVSREMMNHYFIIRISCNCVLNDFWIDLFYTTKVKAVFTHLRLRLGYEMLLDNRDRVEPYFCVITVSSGHYFRSSDFSKTVEILWDIRYIIREFQIKPPLPLGVQTSQIWNVFFYIFDKICMKDFSNSHENAHTWWLTCCDAISFVRLSWWCPPH